MNAPKESPVWPAIRMFGGSPISVAVPPMLEATISITISGTGSTSSASASRNVIGTISRIVVTLSRNADSTAVVIASDEDDRQRPARGDLPGADRQPRVDAGGLGDADHDHHPDEQADRVEVDRLDRLLLIERAGEHDERRRRAARSSCGRRAQTRSARARRQRRRWRNAMWCTSGVDDESPTRLPGTPPTTLAAGHGHFRFRRLASELESAQRGPQAEVRGEIGDEASPPDHATAIDGDLAVREVDVRHAVRIDRQLAVELAKRLRPCQPCARVTAQRDLAGGRAADRDAMPVKDQDLILV